MCDGDTVWGHCPHTASVWDDEKVLEVAGGDSSLHVNAHKAAECALTNGRDGIFYGKHTKPR